MTSAARHRPGFTLIEVLVALALMALLAGMGWQGLSGLLRAREQTTARVDASARVYTALAQWRADLDAMQVIPISTLGAYAGTGAFCAGCDEVF